MSGPEVLGGGPDWDRPVGLPGRVGGTSAAARRRRWTGLVATVLVGAAAAVLAARSLPAADPEPAPTAPTAGPTPGRFVVTAAVGTEWVYALMASCSGPEQERECSFQLHRRSVGGGEWTATAVRVPRRPAAGNSPLLYVIADDVVTLLDQPTVGPVYLSPDGGNRVEVRSVHPGSPVSAAAPGDVLSLGLCESCQGQLTVLEPGTGLLRPLRTQPPLRGRGAGIRAVAESGGVIWALGDSGSRLVTAVSLDRGRSWRVLPVPGARAPVDIARLVSDGGRGAYLVLGRDFQQNVLNEFTELWRVGDPTRPGAAWRPITPSTRPRSAVSVVGASRGLLVAEEDGGVWRLLSDGTMRRLPAADYDGVPLAPGSLVTGPSRLLVAVPYSQPDLPAPTLLVSSDEGESWQVEQVPD